MLEYWLDLLFAADVERVVINLHHHADMVQEYVQRTAWRDRAVLVREPELLGTAGTILRQQEQFSSGPFIVAHADNLSVFDCRAFVHRHARRPAGCVMTMMTFRTQSPESCGIVALDQAEIVCEFHEKVTHPPGNLANAAVYVLEPDVLDYLRGLKKSFIDFSSEVIPHFLGRIYTFHNAEYHEDIGTLAHWRRAQSEYSGPFPSMPQQVAWDHLLNAYPDIERTVATLLSGSDVVK